MRENIKKIREIQLIAAALLEIEPELKVKQANSEIVDLFVELPIDSAKFAIIAWPSRDFGSHEYVHFLKSLETHIEDLIGCPLYIAYYDEGKGLMIGSLVIWDFSETKIIKHVELVLLTNENKDKLFDSIRRQDHQIRLLKEKHLMVIKTIKLSEDRRGFKCNAEMVYLRDFTPEYKMKPKEVTDQQERFYRNLNGQPQDEYPHDLLDDTILEAVRKVYPEANVNNSMLVTNSEYRGFLRFRNYQKDYAEFRFLPDLSVIPIDLYPKLGKIDGVNFVIDIFMLIRKDKNAFADEGFELRFPLDGWFGVLSQFIKELNTMHRVIDVINTGN